jgi:drug/metabolite transporter (DMT)-like permease
VLIAYTMPVWTVIFAWPVLGERPTLLRLTALVMAFAGLAAIIGADGPSASMPKLPGVVMALGAAAGFALGFALGTVLAKKRPILMPPIPAARIWLKTGAASTIGSRLLLTKSMRWTHLRRRSLGLSRRRRSISP